MEDWYTITGAIDVNTAHQLINYLNGQIYRTDIKKLKLLISSSGGDMDSAIRIYSYLKALSIEVETIAFSQIDSAANIIYAAGSKRIAIKGCRFFLHEGTFTTGAQTTTLHNHEEALSLFKELRKKHIDILSKETSKKEEEINKFLQESTILSAEKAKELGLVHEIMEKLPLTKQA
jgi:ATP-dependent Clp protease protease subunit